MAYQIITAVALIVLLTGLIGNVFYKARKTIKNKNDERWQSIQSKANKATVWYHSLLIVVLGLMIFLDVFYRFQTSYSLSQILNVAFVVLTLQFTIELIFLIYLDKKL
ncbi:hypothetical protein ACE6ED_24815 [Paenibacillus sp. CN-4]|uniref:hypothetical protein n=1 Tax=Paenibacillus nanchangensis TaxID=3348343 RepID=UPI00397D7566